ncbi:YdeI/OmpD-associated family protein [Candidatus Saccharibacteria bacterium]|nr:YdeI/OmpD-associated family protein [Candidatus Saccharibacteria bacterium]
MAKIIDDAAAHKIPVELRQILASDQSALKTWNNLTPLARNEWICWITSAKKPATGARRLERANKELSAGKRRPCCWPGCPHRQK